MATGQESGIFYNCVLPFFSRLFYSLSSLIQTRWLSYCLVFSRSTFLAGKALDILLFKNQTLWIFSHDFQHELFLSCEIFMLSLNNLFDPNNFL